MSVFVIRVSMDEMGKVYFAECGIFERCILRNFTRRMFCKLHHKGFSAFRKIQIKSNSQLSVDLSSHLSLESISAHHKWRGHSVITY